MCVFVCVLWGVHGMCVECVTCARVVCVCVVYGVCYRVRVVCVSVWCVCVMSGVCVEGVMGGGSFLLSLIFSSLPTILQD